MRSHIHLLMSSCTAALLVCGWTSAQTVTQFASGVTAPQDGLILTGSSINPATGKPYRHLWFGDSASGLCRLDPDVASPGLHSINPATCLKTAFGINFKPGELSLDPATNDLYAIDMEGKSLGVWRLHYLPGGDSGQGLISTTQVELLGGQGTAVDHCNLGANTPTAGILGPDGNLYVGFSHTGNIMRIESPQTEPLPCSNIQSDIASTLDHASDFGFGWIGHDLFGADSVRVLRWANGDQCFTPQNGFVPCPAALTFIMNPSLMKSDQIYPALNGNNLYLASHTLITLVSNVENTIMGPVITNSYGGIFQFISGLGVDNSNPASPVLYVGDDPTAGGVDGQGRWWQIVPPPPPPAPPGAPTGVIATPGDTTATVTWTPAQDGQTVTSYTVHNSLASNGILVPDVLVTAIAGTTIVPTSTTVGGLIDGASYQFEVKAGNSLGSSPWSAPGNLVTPEPITVPGAPANIGVLPSNAQVLVAWTAPSNGGSPITSYTVTALAGGAPTGITATAAGTATGTAVTGLTNGTTYTFTVHATNAIGNGPESAPSAPATPTAPVTPPDMAITMSGPSSVSFLGNAAYTLTVTNNGPVSAPQVQVTDTLPGIGAALVSSTPTQGSCLASSSQVVCNLGSMAAGTAATITITINMAAQGANQASVQAEDANGLPLTDPVPGNNSASVTTAISGATSTTDIQVTGSAQNGGPAVGSADTFTWQVKNGNNQVANAVVFTNTLPSTMVFTAASASPGSCRGPAAGSSGGTVTCTISSLPVGQTMVITVNVTLPNPGTMSTNSSAIFNGADTNAANNSFSVTIGVK